ncbi:hypothetical protein [Noviherbaspirillum saxi]|uniref:Uncharacterized protein n=1 Tax=Noviherbaspirillum saxi TaxID=2320863 RepID=A0A3A3G9C7_9BURK|nr:hypothetical protein [Noviherbaspirillum saxi]RJF98765.1 hypothetical protein D3871_09745 [Noviherbaspirillum saxi]
MIMHDLSVIKNAVYHVLDDDSEEPEAMRQAAFRSIVGPHLALEMVEALEQRPDAEQVAELKKMGSDLAVHQKRRCCKT